MIVDKIGRGYYYANSLINGRIVCRVEDDVV